MLGVLAAIFTFVLLCGPGPARAFEVFQDPNCTPPGEPATLPTDGSSVTLRLCLRQLGNPSEDPNLACSGAEGDEFCGWDLHIEARDGARLDGFVKEPGADIVSNCDESNCPGGEMRANGGNPIRGQLGTHPLGTLTVSASSAPATVEVMGNLYVTSALATAQIDPSQLASAEACADGDDDQACDDIDNCPFVWNPEQDDCCTPGASGPDGIGDACQCGDVTGDGQVNSFDATMIKRKALNLSAPLFNVPGNCDVTGDGNCNSFDATMITRKALNLSAPLFGNGCPNYTGVLQ